MSRAIVSYGIMFGLVMLVLLGVSSMFLAQQVEPDFTLPDTVKEDGLSLEHIREISRPGVTASRCDELREEYQNDSYAQQMINIFDPTKKEFHEKAEEYIAANLLGDEKKIAELESWFEEFYPDFR